MFQAKFNYSKCMVITWDFHNVITYALSVNNSATSLLLTLQTALVVPLSTQCSLLLEH